MNIKKGYIIVTVITSIILISVSLTTSGIQAGNTKVQQQPKLFVPGQLGLSINSEAVKNSVNLYKNLSEDKKIAIKEKMVKKSQDRQKSIEAVGKQIKEIKLQGKMQKSKTQEEKVSQLQAIQKLALEENAVETAKKLEVFINKIENIPTNESTVKNSL